MLPIELAEFNFSTFLFGILICGFIAYYETNNNKKAIISAFCFSTFDMIYFAFSQQHLGYLIAVIIALVNTCFLKKLDISYAFICLLLGGVVISISLGLSYQYIYEALKWFAGIISKKPAFFGVVNDVYSMVFGNELSELIYHKQYSGTSFINGKIYSGAVDIFEHTNKSPKISVARYLTGKYFVNIFCVLGAIIALYNKLSSRGQLGLILLGILSVLFGNSEPFSLFLFCYNPFMYFGYLFVVFICYLTPFLLKLKIGFINSASIFELLKYGNDWVYFLITGVLVLILTYFVLYFVLSKLDISESKIIPKDVKRLIIALGGERNIERIDGDDLYVKNPNLINILKVDCEIHHNKITLFKDDMDLLKDYL